MKKSLLAISLIGVLYATSYIQESTPIFDSKGEKIGVVIVGSGVEVKNQDSKNAQIELKGYRPKGGKTIYDTLGVLSSSVLLDKSDNVKVLGIKVDDYDNEWEEVEIVGNVDAKKLGADNQLAKGKALFEERCGVCHALHAYDEFSKNVWPSTIKSMTGNAGLSSDEEYLITKFLQSVAPGDEE